VLGVGTMELSQVGATVRAVWARGSPGSGERAVPSMDLGLLAALPGCCLPWRQCPSLYCRCCILPPQPRPSKLPAVT